MLKDKGQRKLWLRGISIGSTIDSLSISYKRSWIIISFFEKEVNLRLVMQLSSPVLIVTLKCSLPLYVTLL